MNQVSAWTERCRCGRCKEIDWKFIVEGSNSPKRTIRWYDSEGNLERITGDVGPKDLEKPKEGQIDAL